MQHWRFSQVCHVTHLNYFSMCPLFLYCCCCAPLYIPRPYPASPSFHSGTADMTWVDTGPSYDSWHVSSQWYSQWYLHHNPLFLSVWWYRIVDTDFECLFFPLFALVISFYVFLDLFLLFYLPVCFIYLYDICCFHISLLFCHAIASNIFVKVIMLMVILWTCMYMCKIRKLFTKYLASVWNVNIVCKARVIFQCSYNIAWFKTPFNACHPCSICICMCYYTIGFSDVI